MDRIDDEYSAETRAETCGVRESDGSGAAPRREPVDFTYNGFLGFPISDWLTSLFSKKTSVGR